MIAFVFPGQGSQRRGMGAELFGASPEYAAVERDVDKLMGCSLRELCVDDRLARLNQTQYTQPALFVVNALHYYAARRSGAAPAIVAGHSLGEYNALHAAGAFDLLTGLRLVIQRGQLMAQVRNGGMAAVSGLDAAVVARVIEQNGLRALDVANFNTPTQTVISGPAADIERAGPVFEKAGATLFLPLPVSAAFHSRYMIDTAARFEEFMAPVAMNRLSLPVISNVTAALYPAGEEGATIKANLVRQIRQPVLWRQSVDTMRRLGVTDFRELGPANVLTRLIAQIPTVPAAAAVARL